VLITAKCCEFESHSWQDIRDTTRYVCDLHGSVFSSSSVSSTNKTERQDIVEILVKVALNTITILKAYIGFEP
jgi:hypothetical protein